MIVKGLDRIEGTPIFGMSDELWRSHTAELKSRFAQQHSRSAGKVESFDWEQDQQDSGDTALEFARFCEQFATEGGKTTAAMVTHYNSQWRPPRQRPGLFRHSHAASRSLVAVGAACMAATLFDFVGMMGTCTAVGSTGVQTGTDTACGSLNTASSCKSVLGDPTCRWRSGWPWWYPALGVFGNVLFMVAGWHGPANGFIRGVKTVER